MQWRLTGGVTRDDGPVTVETLGDGTVRALPGIARHPERELAGTPKIILGLLLGRIWLEQALANEIECKGDRKVF
jgi:hypothetical protein